MSEEVRAIRSNGLLPVVSVTGAGLIPARTVPGPPANGGFIPNNVIGVQARVKRIMAGIAVSREPVK